MLPVAGIPFTEHQIAKARAAGIEEIVLATSYRAEVFEPHFGNGENFGIKVSYAVEESALGTGGAIANAAKMLKNSGPVVIFNGDVLSSHDLKAQIDLHISGGADITLHLTEVSDARAFGVVELSGERILTFNEKMENPPTNIINAGCYIFNREIIDSIPLGQVVSVERETFPQLIEAGKVLLGYIDSSYWLDIGTPATLLKATRDLISGRASSPALDLLLQGGGYEVRGGSLIARSAIVDPSARIEGGSLICAGVVIEAGVLVQGSIIFERVHIGSQASLVDTFVAANTEIPAAFIAEGQFFGFFQ